MNVRQPGERPSTGKKLTRQGLLVDVTYWFSAGISLTGVRQGGDDRQGEGCWPLPTTYIRFWCGKIVDGCINTSSAKSAVNRHIYCSAIKIEISNKWFKCTLAQPTLTATVTNQLCEGWFQKVLPRVAWSGHLSELL